MKKSMVACMLAVTMMGTLTACGAGSDSTATASSSGKAAVLQQKPTEDTSEEAEELEVTAASSGEGENNTHTVTVGKKDDDTSATSEAAEASSEEAAKADAKEESAASDIDYTNTDIGALYQNGVLTYGPASINIGECTVYTPEEDPSVDYLINAAGDGYFYVMSADEDSASYEDSDADGILESYTADGVWTDASMLDFQKFELGDFYCILYTMHGTISGSEEYATELIMMDDKIASKSIRVINESLSEESSEAARQAFADLKLCTDASLYEGRESIGDTKILAK